MTRDVPPSDAELVGRYVADRDEAAFATIVQRHGSAVLGVCRRLLGDGPDADDAFQATFLVLVRKAHRVAFRPHIASWLFAVAMRASRELLRQRSRRRARETHAEHLDAPAPPPSDSAEDCRVLLEEIAKLAETYRAPVVLCELAGVSRSEAAKQLGVPEGTLSSRLAEARKRLARRLRGRGVAASVGILAVPVTPALAARVRDLATTFAVPSRTVVQIAEAIMRTTFTTRKLAAVAVLLAAVVGLGLSEEPAKNKAEEAKPPVAVKKADSDSSRLYLIRDGRFYALDTDGGNERRILLSGTGASATAQPSLDGRSLAHWHAPNPKEPQSALVIADRHGTPIGKRVSLPPNGGYRRFCWSPDGTQLLVSQSSGNTPPGGVEHYTVDVKTRAVTTLKTLRGHIVTDWSGDGKYFLTTKVGETKRWEPKSIYLMNADGTEHKRLAGSDGSCLAMRLSPDGAHALCLLDGKLAVVNTSDPKAPAFVEGIPDGAEITGAAWSPDGKRIAYCTGTFQFLEKEQLRDLESRLVVADPTGKNAKVVRSVKGESFDSVFWR